MDRDWHVSETLFKDLGLDPLSESSPIEKAEIVTCPEEFVETGMRVKTWKDNNGQVERFQPINMKNPISGMSISGDEGKTWAKMSQFGNTDSFLRPSSLSSETSKLLLRVESWMGGSDEPEKVTMALILQYTAPCIVCHSFNGRASRLCPKQYLQPFCFCPMN